MDELAAQILEVLLLTIDFVQTFLSAFFNLETRGSLIGRDLYLSAL
jgi:hypothetical protein